MQMTSKEIHKYILSLFIVASFVILIAILVFFDVKSGSKEIVFTLLGGLGSAFGAVINFYFGSSEGSKEKTKLLGDK